MAGKVIDELLYLGLGAAVAELVDVLTVKHGDSRASMNIAMLGAKAGKPSVYIPGATGVAALVYAGYQGDKYGRLKDEETVILGYGIYSLVKTAGKVLATQGTSGVATGILYAPGGVILRQSAPQMGGYPAETNGSRRGAI